MSELERPRSELLGDSWGLSSCFELLLLVMSMPRPFICVGTRSFDIFLGKGALELKWWEGEAPVRGIGAGREGVFVGDMPGVVVVMKLKGLESRLPY